MIIMRSEIFFAISMVLFSLMFISVIVRAQESITLQTVYAVRTEIFKNDTATLLDISATNGTVSHFASSNTSYSIRVLSNNGNELFRGYTFISFSLITDSPVSIEFNSTVIQLRVPFYANAKSIAVYHFENKILDIDLSKKFCNSNSICDLGENIYNCPSDCKPPQSEFPWFYIVVGIIALAIVITIYLISRKYTIIQV